MIALAMKAREATIIEGCCFASAVSTNGKCCSRTNVNVRLIVSGIHLMGDMSFYYNEIRKSYRKSIFRNVLKGTASLFMSVLICSVPTGLISPSSGKAWLTF